MFRGLINDVKSAAGSVIAKYLARASVAVPFVVALGFATAAITFTLVDRFGVIIAYWIVAAGFTLIGLVATLAITVKEQEEEVAEKQAEQTDTAGVSTDAAAQAAREVLHLFVAPVGQLDGRHGELGAAPKRRGPIEGERQPFGREEGPVLGLPAGNGEIEDAESPVAQCRHVIAVSPGIVGSAVAKRMRHRADKLDFQGCSTTDDASYSTHG